MSRKLSIGDDPLEFLGGNEAITLPIDDIVVEEQVRREFGDEEIEALAESIKQVGLINPPVVRRKGMAYVIIDGERRLKACKLLGVDSVLCSIKDIKDEDIHGAQIIANVHRKDLTLIELYYGLKLYQDKGMSMRDIVVKTGIKKNLVEEILKGRKFEDKLKDLPSGEEGNKEFRKLAAAEGIIDPVKKNEVQSNPGNFTRSGIDKIKKNSKPQKVNKNKDKKGLSEFRTAEGGGDNTAGKSETQPPASGKNQEPPADLKPKNPRDIAAIEAINKSMKIFNDAHVSIKLKMAEDADGYHLNVRVATPATAEQIVDAIGKIFN